MDESKTTHDCLDEIGDAQDASNLIDKAKWLGCLANWQESQALEFLVEIYTLGYERGSA